MDLSFTLESSQRLPHWGVSLDDIMAVADRRRLDSARGEAGAKPLSMEKGAGDLVHILACRLVLDTTGFAETERLGGSFNPLIAHQLMVGEKGEDGVYRRALADVQRWTA